MFKSFSPFSESLQMRMRTTRQHSLRMTLLSLIQKRGRSPLQTAAPPGGGDTTNRSLHPTPKSRRAACVAALGASLERGLQPLLLLSSFSLRVSNNRKAESKDTNMEEQKTRKKPGPKPGWKKKIKCEREELPNIYKCPYQGCTAVYRGADGMKKHIKEHHEEVRERPCPHPGCNKVFMIDRYLQRHVKLIHTEVRNYICDECGQTFKQRKHLSVHQMRHSGAKPLQCEICGFQCRQRASLKYHMTKHKAEAELEFACDQCGKRFEKAHNLNVHMSMVHPLTQTQEKAKGTEPEPRALLDTVEGQPIKVERSVQQEPT
uniref:Zinc finger protein 276 n=1 Tax=Laticauda laticaudata TaxID=8630 RepID=A0A8C5S7C5_LATLA